LKVRDVVVASFSHETNTFSPIPTPFEAFGPHGGPLYGDDVPACPGSPPRRDPGAR